MNSTILSYIVGSFYEINKIHLYLLIIRHMI